MAALSETDVWRRRAMTALIVMMISFLATTTASVAQPPDPIPPKLSVVKALFFHDHPEAWRQFLAELPRRPSGRPQPNRQPASPPFGGSWTAVTLAPEVGLSNPLLLTDGTVIAHIAGTQTWYKLTPDIHGSYAAGSWSQIASLPNGYGPLYFASAVLPSGDVVMQGGEYNESCDSANTESWSSLGAIYDPVANSWKSVSPPSGSGWINTDACGTKRANGGVGDAASIVLPNGTFMLSSCCADPPLDALFNPVNRTYQATGAPLTYQNEQGYTLLHGGNILTIDVWNPPNAQEYNPGTGTWSYIASAPVSLIDPTACGNYEIGPAVTRPDGTVVAFGGNTGCTSSPADPTAIYNPASNSWAVGNYVPEIDGAYFDLADAPAALLPNGNVLFAASPRYGQAPTHFFEFTSATSSPPNSISQVSDPLYFSSLSGAYEYNFLVLPNGQILMTDFSDVAEVYTPTGGPSTTWQPTVSSVSRCVTPGDTYPLSGTQLNGLSQGAAYGDDVQGATNFPLVRIVNNSSGHVFYGRTFDHSTMSIAPGKAGSTHFAVAQSTELGPSKLYVVANGIASAATDVLVANACPALTVAPAGDIAASGPKGGAFTPLSFSYHLSATSGSLSYSITGLPKWLSASSTSGTVTTSPHLVTFDINANAEKRAVGSYIDTIKFNNVTDGLGNTTRTARLTVKPGSKIVVEASPKADGTVAGGGIFADGSSCTVTATANAGFKFVHWTENGDVVSKSATYEFKLEANVTLVAHFKAESVAEGDD